MQEPLSGIRILELANAIAGPYCGMFLADLGAEVIKIEPEAGDVGRFAAGPNYKGENLFYLSLNRNKKGIILDLGTNTGKKAFLELVKISDVVLDNLRPGVLERLGIDYETLKKTNERIISCSVTGYGSSGPRRDNPAYDVTILGVSGILSVTGEPNGSPVRPGIPVADLGGALMGAIGILTALLERERTGKGKRVEVSLLDACISMLIYHLATYLNTGIIPKPLGTQHRVSIPSGAYRTKDGYVTIGTSWPRIARAVGADWMIDDPRFSDLQARQEHREEFTRVLEEHLSQAETADWLEIFKEEDIPAGPVYTLDKTAIDPQVLHNKMIIAMQHSLGGEIKLAGTPIKMAGLEEKEYSSPPTLGQHTHQVLKELLHYSDTEIEKLEEEQRQHKEEMLSHVRKKR